MSLVERPGQLVCGNGGGVDSFPPKKRTVLLYQFTLELGLKFWGIDCVAELLKYVVDA